MKKFEDLMDYQKDTENKNSITFDFTEEGGTFFVSNTMGQNEKWAFEFIKLCLIFINNPEMIYHAFELCKDGKVDKKRWINKVIREIKKTPRRYKNK